MIYFDNAATTKPSEDVLKTFEKVLTSNFGNPSSPHAYGHDALNIMEKARAQIGRYLDVTQEEVIFTSGATESNNLAIFGTIRRYKKMGKRIITTKIEHASVLEPIKELESIGYDVIYLDVDKDGHVDLNEFSRSLTSDTILVSIMAVNNEVGIVLPIDEMARMAKEKTKAFFHTDATQGLYKVPLELKNIDLISMSAHKLNGLKSSGVLIKRKKMDLEPLLYGGGQESGLRSGTSNPAVYAALASTLRVAKLTYDERREKAMALNKYLLEELSKNDNLIITSPSNSSPFILGIALTRHKASVVVEALANKGIMVSTKSACSSKKVGGSYVLKALGYSDDISENAIRLSFSGYEGLDQGKEFISVFNRVLQELKER